MTNIVFNKAVRKVVKDVIKHIHVVSTTLYYSQMLKQLIKPCQALDIYLTKEQQLLGMVDWLIKDLEAWDAMCEWWVSEEFRALLERNQHNRQSKASVLHYGVNSYICKTQRIV
jgi:hypothetical protein